jgi:CshA-type fibril repeat protein
VKITRLLPVWAALAVLGGLVVAPATAASAAPAPPPTLTARAANGSAAADVTVGDTVSLSAAAPITRTGSTQQQIEATWDPASARFAAGRVTAPEGWPVEYTTDGSTWSTTAPGDPATVRGIRAAGDVESKGYASEVQSSTTSGSGELKSAAGSFQGTSGGDGWDVFFAEDKVLNVWHHNPWAYNLDCHVRTDGASCSESVYTVEGYTTANGSGGSVVGSKVYSVVGETASNSVGVLCTDVSASPFTSCGYTALRAGSSDYNDLGTQALVKGRVYAPLVSGELICFDTATNAACGDQPYTLPSFARTYQVPAYATAVEGKLFVTAQRVYCFDGATGTPCAGTWPAGNFDGQITNSVVPMRATNGTLTGVCSMMPAGTCFDLTGAGVAVPAGFAAVLASKPSGGLGGYTDWAFTKTRQYWATGYAPGTAVCYDWKTDSACTGFNAPEGAVGDARYAIRIDPADPTCVWSNGDNGQITAFDGLTGASGCTTPTHPVMSLPYDLLVPRMACLEAGRVRSWTDITFAVPAGIPTSALHVAVKTEDGSTVTGWADRTVDENGKLDLSDLAVTDTGTTPTFEVTAVDATRADAEQIIGALTYSSDAPELCVDLTVAKDCPVLEPGISATPTAAVTPVTFSGRTVATADEVGVVTPLSVNVTRAAMSGCFGGVTGTVEHTYSGGAAPIGNQPVQLLGPDDEVLGTTTADTEGRYSFDNVHPGAYRVAVGDAGQSVAVTAGATAAADVAVPVAAPTARPVTSTTIRDTATTFETDVTADPVTTVEPESVELYDSPAEMWRKTVTVEGEGTWEVTDSGALRFTPLAGFTGDTTAIRYRAADGFGTHAGATATVTVLELPPTARPVSEEGIQGGSLTIVPDGVPSGPALDPTKTRLLEPSSGQTSLGMTPVETMTVAGVGTYAVQPDGTIRFTPVGTFTGSHSVVYQVGDVAGGVATSTATVTLEPITLLTGPAKKGASPLEGVPAGATVTLPPTVPGAAAVSYSGGNIVVTPAKGFSGTIRVPVTVTYGTATVTTTAVVVVTPAPATAATRTLHKGRTLVTWKRSGSAKQYEVRVNGKKVCVTSQLACSVGGLAGPKATVQVIALGGDATRSTATVARYRASACTTVGSVRFPSDSATLTTAHKRELKRVAALVRAQGFTEVCIVGHTDSTGETAYNTKLAKKRVKAVRAQLDKSLGRVTFRPSSAGEQSPARSNASEAGKAANRRVEIGLR